MKAIKYEEYGSPDILTVVDVQKPVPKTNEVLIKIKASSSTRADTMMRKGNPYIGRLFLGLRKPKYTGMGTGFAGVIEAIGASVTQFEIGEDVFGESVFGSGTNAEYVCIPEDGIIVKKPGNLSFEEACSACDGPLTALNFLRDVAQLQAGQQVLIIGASGSVGSAAVQIAKHFGAEVTAVCSGANTVWVKTLGTDRVLDYTREDFTKEISRYDIIFDAVGQSSFSHSKNSLTENGIYLSPVFNVANLFQMLWTNQFNRKKAKFSATGMRATQELRELLVELNSLFESHRLHSVIDRRYQLTDVASAHSYIDKGHKKGNVVIVM